MTLDNLLKKTKRDLALFNEFYIKSLIPNLNGKTARKSLILTGGLMLSGIISDIAHAYQLNVHVSKDDWSPQSTATVTATDGSDSTTQQTNASGNILFNKTGNTIIKITKNGYTGMMQSFFINSDTTINGVQYDTLQQRIGWTTGRDTINFKPSQWHSIYNIDETVQDPTIRAVPKPDSLGVPFHVRTGFNLSDSLKIAQRADSINDYAGAWIYVHGIVSTDTSKGISVQLGSQNQTYSYAPANELINSRVELNAVADRYIDHEDFYHGMSLNGEHTTNYTPTNFVLVPIITLTPKDIVYTMKFIKHKYEMEHGLNDFKSFAYKDSLTFTGVEGQPEQTTFPFKSISLSNYPNPAKNYTNISYTLPFSEKTTVSLYNVTGQKVAVQECPAGPGQNAIRLNLAAYPSGVYIYRISAKSQTATGKFVISR